MNTLRYDLWIAHAYGDDPRVVALRQVLESLESRLVVKALGGCDVAPMGGVVGEE